MGKILSASDMGIRISMGFFDDIFVPAPGLLFDPAKYIKTEEGDWVWVWESSPDPDSLLYFDVNEMVRFRVEAETWTDLSPEKQPAPGEEVEVYRRSPYEITVSSWNSMCFVSHNANQSTGIHATQWTWPSTLVGST